MISGDDDLVFMGQSGQEFPELLYLLQGASTAHISAEEQNVSLGDVSHEMEIMGVAERYKLHSRLFFWEGRFSASEGGHEWLPEPSQTEGVNR